jgi:hypothetical protein
LPPETKDCPKFFSYRVIEIWNNPSTKVGNANLDDLIDPEMFANYLDRLPTKSIILLDPVFDYDRR